MIISLNRVNELKAEYKPNVITRPPRMKTVLSECLLLRLLSEEIMRVTLVEPKDFHLYKPSIWYHLQSQRKQGSH